MYDVVILALLVPVRFLGNPDTVRCNPPIFFPLGVGSVVLGSRRLTERENYSPLHIRIVPMCEGCFFVSTCGNFAPSLAPFGLQEGAYWRYSNYIPCLRLTNAEPLGGGYRWYQLVLSWPGAPSGAGMNA
ncbi:uncharacterized protein BO66DRAFT_33403 [Aspergillus aculeatinus CBS 121060]|uniref:Uncharacterized protein n=1 Tax=Aspergillus aculeatinus CBS 121060 TaxID=1448322 RepID=A0ACD1HFK4_9EURO|nr:hypothetical protein BO66DRAFT_33403 [Aspergillus aculeatinus CBS 121060]RAH72344.1 hypothetical protein BO66DRAFT_33403 [Aspergillus aculeatinus CBS 121060]